MKTRRAGAFLIGGLLAALAFGPGAAAQEAGESAAQRPELDWTPWVSDVPSVDLTGNWDFLPNRSDPMVETWAGRDVVYEISQQSARIVLAFRPDNGEPNVQEYRWDGSVNEFQRGTAEVRERARWTRNGRVLEVEGRWWLTDDTASVFRYTFRYEMEANRVLVFRQQNEHGETVWRFTR